MSADAVSQVRAPAILEIGPGESPLPACDTLDVVERVGITHVACWGQDRLPVADASYDQVYASHVLEHVPWNQTQQALGEAGRVLKPGGFLELWVPDFEYIVKCYLEQRCGDAWRRDNPGNNHMQWVNGRLFTYGPGAENYHRACFDEAHLRSCLKQAGFIDVERLKQRTRGVSHGRIDLGMRGVRP